MNFMPSRDGEKQGIESMVNTLFKQEDAIKYKFNIENV